MSRWNVILKRIKCWLLEDALSWDVYMYPFLIMLSLALLNLIVQGIKVMIFKSFYNGLVGLLYIIGLFIIVYIVLHIFQGYLRMVLKMNKKAHGPLFPINPDQIMTESKIGALKNKNIDKTVFQAGEFRVTIPIQKGGYTFDNSWEVTTENGLIIVGNHSNYYDKGEIILQLIIKMVRSEHYLAQIEEVKTFLKNQVEDEVIAQIISYSARKMQMKDVLAPTDYESKAYKIELQTKDTTTDVAIRMKW